MESVLPKRKTLRLQGHDYSTPGYYFVTLCTEEKRQFLSKIVWEGLVDAPKLILSDVGKIVERELESVETHYTNVKIDKYVIMPNHIHMIICITERINPFPTSPKYDIPNVVGKFKAAVTRNVGKAFMPSAKTRLWQRGYHDHIIRGERDYLKIWEYIDTNPARWESDCFYSE